MSITIGTTPDQIASAYLDNIWKVTSDRFPDDDYSVSSVSDNGSGYCRYSAAGHTFKVGDIISGSGFDPKVTYNVRQTVTAIAAGTVDTNVVFDGTDTGTFTRDNQNFQILGELIQFGVNSILTISLIDLIILGGEERIRITTTTSHGYIVGDFVCLTGTTNYNNVYEVIDIVDSTNFTIIETFGGAETSGSVEKGDFIGSKRQKVDIDGTNFVFNFKNFLETIMTFDFETLGQSNIITPNSNSLSDYMPLFTEEFDNIDGELTQYDKKAELATRQICNTIVQQEETQDLTAFLTEGTTRRFLTNAPNPKNIFENDEEQLSFIAEASKSYKIRYEQFNSAGGSIGTTDTSLVAIQDNRGIVPINNNMWTSVVSKIDVWLINDAGTQKSEKRRFNILRACFFNPFPIYFLNRRGGFDLYTFTGDYLEAVNTSKPTYQKSLPEGFTPEDRGITVLSAEGRNRVEVFSGFLTRAEGIWLGELTTSIEAKWYDGTNLIPIIIINNKEILTQIPDMTQYKLIFDKPELVLH